MPRHYSLSEPQVRTSKGWVVGLSVDHTNTTGAQFLAFIGIPYADQPPRFQLAKPRTHWDGLYMTQKDGPACPQPTKTPYSEDCLYLNVFTPQDATSCSRYPVMVYLHGSAFTYSSSFSKRLGPDFLVSRGVILVTLNYRLGPLGFLTLGSKAAPGNLGLHDSLLALQWVQEEISKFGGDSGRVTLFGQSAGACMTLFHYLSPISAGVGGLFHRAIAQSGSPLADWGHYSRAEGIRRAKLLARAVNCDVTQDDSVLLHCLQQVDIATLVNNTYIPLGDEFDVPGLRFPFLPVLDDASWSPSPFFSDSLHNLIMMAIQRSIPLMTGFNTQEGILFIDGSEKWKLAEDKLDTFIPQSVRSDLSEEKSALLTEDIRMHYFSSSLSSSDIKMEELINLYTDTTYAFPAVLEIICFRKFTYGYVFDYNGSWKIPNSYFSQFNVSGVAHGDELPYIFAGKGTQTFESTEENAPDLKVKNLMTKLWTNFAKTGIPSCNWKPVSTGYFLRINSTPCLLSTKSVKAKYYNFWARLISTAKSSHSNIGNVLTEAA